MAEVNLHEKILVAYSTTAEGNMDERFSDRSVIMANRRKFFNQFGLNPKMIVEGKQIHSDRILVLDSENTKMWLGMNIPGVDGFVTSENEVGLIIKVADCVPVVMYDPENHKVGLFHAGWQGTVKNIHLKGIEKLQAAYNSDPSKLLVWLGPNAKKCCFTSTEEPKQINDPEWNEFITNEGEVWKIDLEGYIKKSIVSAGVKEENITIDPQCTVETESLFSHQRTKKTNGQEGRFLVLAKLR